MSSTPVPDPEVAGLIEAANSLQAGYQDADPAWRDSPFAWIKARPSRQVGVIGERLVAAWLESKGLTVERSPDAECDRVIQGKRVEVKFSTLWKSGVYRFQQIREQNYDLVICLGLSPFDAHCWVIPKAQVLEQWGAGMPFQHGGKRGRDTVWLAVDPSSPPGWLEPRSGGLSDAFGRLCALIGIPRVHARGSSTSGGM